MNCRNIKIKILILSLVIVQSTLANGNTNEKKLLDSKVGKQTNILLLRYNLKNFIVSDKLNNKKNPVYNDDDYKSPWLAFFLSMFLPTGGQIYNGDYTKALIQGGLMLGGLGLAAGMSCVECGEPESPQKALFFTGIGIALSGYVWSIIDAPISANRHNSRIQKGLTIWKSDKGKYTLKVSRNLFREIYSLNLQVKF